MSDKAILRVIDANVNRAKEGLRVLEDIFRFIVKHDKLRKRVRYLRHGLDSLAQEKLMRQAIESRNALADPGKHVDYLEMKRGDVADILYSNFQRVKESLRVLEEFFKLLLPQKVSRTKRMRYTIYVLEKDTLKFWPPVRHSRH